jgi:pimeloyl-ACP methyl ester carboxylesterase
MWDSARDCIALLDHLGIQQASLFGASQGAFVALRLALRTPASGVRRSTIMGPPSANLHNMGLGQPTAWNASLVERAPRQRQRLPGGRIRRQAVLLGGGR